MQGRALVVVIGSSLGALGGLALGCAGSATPATDEPVASQIAAAYGVPEAGGAGGAGGSGAVLAPGSGTGGSPASALATSGAGGSAMAGGAGSTGAAGSGPCDGYAVLAEHCSGGSCHGSTVTGSDALSNFALSEDAAKGFVGKPSATCAAQDNADLLDPGNPGASLVVRKVTNTSSCGNPMPLGGAPLSIDELNCLKDWIASL